MMFVEINSLIGCEIMCFNFSYNWLVMRFINALRVLNRLQVANK